MNYETRQLANDIFLPQVVELLKEGHTVTLPLRGRSMRPFLEDGRDKALLQLAKEPQVGDAVLAEISKGHFVLHRIILIDGEQVTLRGDGNLSDEYCLLADIRAKAVGFYRKGRSRLDSTDGLKWRAYSWLWTRLFPLRRYLLFALHPHIPHRFLGKATTQTTS
ncbi:MAG: S24/S26 family peptidase [Prevotella sp.]|nr:S24/S26 family peptidase [Prevotella sp.]